MKQNNDHALMKHKSVTPLKWCYRSSNNNNNKKKKK